MGQARLVECGEILKRDFPKGFPIGWFVPILPLNGQGVFIMTLEKHGVGKVPLDENQVVK